MGKELINDIKSEFKRLVSVKNSWGKKEIISVLDEAIINPLLKQSDIKLSGAVVGLSPGLSPEQVKSYQELSKGKN